MTDTQECDCRPPASGLCVHDVTTPAPTPLRDRYAAAIASYDHAVGQATDPAPGDHHHGQADAVMAVRDQELEHLRQRLALADQIHQENVAAIDRVRKALDDAEWGGPDRHDVITEIRAALDPQEQP